MKKIPVTKEEQREVRLMVKEEKRVIKKFHALVSDIMQNTDLCQLELPADKHGNPGWELRELGTTYEPITLLRK